MQEADTYLPQLRERAQQLRQELERERAEVAEIEKCDQSTLRDWREVINEQQSVPTPGVPCKIRGDNC